MARRKSKTPGGQLRDLGARLLALGVAFWLLPLFMSNTVLGRAFQGLSKIGLLMAAAGALVLAGPALLRLSRTQSAAIREFPEPQMGRADAAARPREPQVPAATQVSEAKTWGREMPAFGQENWGRHPQGGRPTAWTPAVLETIEWRRFEALVERLYLQAGFITRTQSHGADGGVDIWLHSRNHPGDRPVSIVQCKHWIGRSVGVDKVRELRGVMAQHGVARGQFVTSSVFTEEAKAFGHSCGINLMDGSALLSQIGRRNLEQQQELLAVALEGEYWRPTCASCGTKMVERTAKASQRAFWGCSGFPRCKATLPMRSRAAH